MRFWLAAALLALASPAAAQMLCLSSGQPGSSLFREAEARNPSHFGGLSCVRYQGPTYTHEESILGNATLAWRIGAHWGQEMILATQLDEKHGFEIVSPRLVDLGNDGIVEVITIRTHIDRGAQIAIYSPDPDNETFRLIATPTYIGRAYRWLVPVLLMVPQMPGERI